MRRIRLLVPLIAVLLALVPAAAFASTAYTESVDGIETGIPQSTPACPAPNSVSPFAGAAVGTLDGAFDIGVCHTPLDPSATILGGTFTITDVATTVSGQFARGGTVTYLGTRVYGPVCVQTYAVSGRLLPSGQFTATLTHYGYWNGVSCNTGFATISGHAQLTT